MSAFESIRAVRANHDGGLGFRLRANPVVRPRGRQGIEFRARQGRELALGVQIVKLGPDLRTVGGPHFQPAHGPVGMRLVPMSMLGGDECRWGLDVDGRMLFCGLAIDPAADSLRACYCPYHGALVGGGFPEPVKLKGWMR